MEGFQAVTMDEVVGEDGRGRSRSPRRVERLDKLEEISLQLAVDESLAEAADESLAEELSLQLAVDDLQMAADETLAVASVASIASCITACKPVPAEHTVKYFNAQLRKRICFLGGSMGTCIQEMRDSWASQY